MATPAAAPNSEMAPRHEDVYQAVQITTYRHVEQVVGVCIRSLGEASKLTIRQLVFSIGQPAVNLMTISAEVPDNLRKDSISLERMACRRSWWRKNQEKPTYKHGTRAPGPESPRQVPDKLLRCAIRPRLQGQKYIELP